MSIVSETQETYKFFTKREFGVSLNTDKIHQIRTDFTLGEVLTLLAHKKVKTKTIKKKPLYIHSNKSNKIPKTFLNLCINDEIKVEEIDDYKKVWRESSECNEGNGIPVYEYLGMTKNQYLDFLEDRNSLKLLVERLRSEL